MDIPYNFDELEKEIGDLPAHTCPDINRVLRDLKSISKSAGAILKMDADDIKSIHDEANSIESDVALHDGTMEGLREANELLRDHADYWKEKTEEILDAWKTSVGAAATPVTVTTSSTVVPALYAQETPCK